MKTSQLTRPEALLPLTAVAATALAFALVPVYTDTTLA